MLTLVLVSLIVLLQVGGQIEICETANENKNVDLLCPGLYFMTSNVFSSYGTPTGSCVTTLRTTLSIADNCHAPSSESIVNTNW